MASLGPGKAGIGGKEPCVGAGAGVRAVTSAECGPAVWGLPTLSPSRGAGDGSNQIL